MSSRSSLLVAPSSCPSSRIGGGETRPPEARAGLPRSRRDRTCIVRPALSLAGLLCGLTLAALLFAMPGVEANSGDGPAGGDFTLQSVDGPVSLRDLRGKVVLLFFGYTSCPDICPLSLLRIGNCLSALEAGQAERVSALFVTLDPARDTPDRMNQYAGFFHPGIIGLTGDTADIDAVAARYGIFWERKSAPESALGYSIAHPDTILLVDADGVLTGEVRGEEGAEALRARVLELLAHQG